MGAYSYFSYLAALTRAVTGVMQRRYPSMTRNEYTNKDVQWVRLLFTIVARKVAEWRSNDVAATFRDTFWRTMWRMWWLFHGVRHFCRLFFDLLSVKLGYSAKQGSFSPEDLRQMRKRTTVLLESLLLSHHYSSLRRLAPGFQAMMGKKGGQDCRRNSKNDLYLMI